MSTSVPGAVGPVCSARWARNLTHDADAGATRTRAMHAPQQGIGGHARTRAPQADWSRYRGCPSKRGSSSKQSCMSRIANCPGSRTARPCWGSHWSPVPGKPRSPRKQPKPNHGHQVVSMPVGGPGGKKTKRAAESSGDSPASGPPTPRTGAELPRPSIPKLKKAKPADAGQKDSVIEIGDDSEVIVTESRSDPPPSRSEPPQGPLGPLR